ncbi:MAG: adenylate/guanylate cyclase domain-containing protein, partial [Deltaproteobacteria bacterium]|nr:adenylate/guanylate cyclase domain-containing protein [Deltaproteobacteria bacterium]
RVVSDVTSDEVSSAVIRDRIKPSTLLFSDIVGITPFFDAHGDVAGRKRLLAHNRLLIPVIRDHQGTLVKTIGDALMALFARAEDGVTAAVEMQQVLAEHNRGVTRQEDAILIRIGLHSGDAIVERRDVLGDTVNVAARVCGKAQGEQILVSEATRAMLPDAAKITSLCMRTELKGKRGKFALYEVAWKAPADDTALADWGDTVILRRRIDGESTAESRPGFAPPRRNRLAVRISVGALAVAAVAVASWRMAASHRAPWPPAAPSQLAAAVEPAAGRAPGQEIVRRTPEASAGGSLAVGDSPPAPAVWPISRPRSVAKERIVERRSAVERSMRAKGILRGDDPKLERSLADMEQLAEREPERALAAADRALVLIRAMRVDRRFIEAKFERFNARYEGAGPDAEARVSPVLETVLALVGRGQFDDANRQLNHAFSLLGPPPR